VNRRQVALAFLSAAMSQRRYAPRGDTTCVTCGEVSGDEGGRRKAFAVCFDLGLATGDGLSVAGVRRDKARGRARGDGGAFLRRVRVAHRALRPGAIEGRPASRACPCAGVVDMVNIEQIPHYAYAFGLVVGDEVTRCAVCFALRGSEPWEVLSCLLIEALPSGFFF
jgi:hypothetical protein